MYTENLVKIVQLLDENISTDFVDPNSVIDAAGKLDFSSFSQKELVNAFNLFFAKRFNQNLALSNRLTPAVIGDLMALITSKLGLLEDNIFDPAVVFPDLLFQFASQLKGTFSLYGKSDDPSINTDIKKLSDLYHFDFKSPNAKKIIISRILGIDFTAESNRMLQESNLKDGESAILLVNSADLQSTDFANLLKKHSELQLIAILKLPTSLFKHIETSLSLLILRRKADNEKVVAQVLLAQIPELSNKENFSKFISQLENWKKENL